MAIFRCIFNFHVSMTLEKLKNVYRWKKIRLSLTKVFNNLKFNRRAIKEEVIPVGFRRRTNTQCINEKKVESKISRLLMKENIKFLSLKQRRLLKQEYYLRGTISEGFNKRDWQLIFDTVFTKERDMFMRTRDTQIRKFSKLIEDRDRCNTEEVQMLDEEYEDEEGVTKERFLNISSKKLSDNQVKLLNRDLGFIPLQRTVDYLNIATEVELSMQRLDLKDDSYPSTIREVVSIGKVTKESDNLSRGEREALQELKEDSSLVISQSDKGNLTVIMDKEDYDRKLFDQLLGGSFNILNKDPSLRIDNAIRKVASRIKKEENQPSKVYHEIVGHHTRHPSIFGMLKVHKIGSPMRLILSSFGSVTSNATNFTKNILNTVLKELKDEVMLSNSHQLKLALEDINEDLDNCIMLSMDVVNMFGNIDPNIALERINELIKRDNSFYSKFNVKIEDFMELIRIVLKNSYCLHEETFYMQEEGIPMGSGLSPIVADIVMLGVEEQMRKLENYLKVAIYRRYRDDSFLLWRGSRGQAEEFLEDMNSLDPKIKFTLEVEENKELAFLDMKLIRENDRIRTRWYTKPYASERYMNFSSYHDLKVKRSIVKGETIRIGKISDEREMDWKILEDRLVKNSFPRKFVRTNMKAGIRYFSKNDTGINKKDVKNKVIFPYLGQKTVARINKASKNFGMVPIYRKRTNLGGILSKTYKQNTNIEAGGIYEISCDCREKYIGETGNKLSKRVEQHKYAVKNMDLKNGIANHKVECQETTQWKGAKFLTYEQNWWKRKVKEGLFIQKDDPKMNIKLGYKPAGNWN